MLDCPFHFFDAHFHIIDSRYPLVSNQGYLPETFPVSDYLQQTKTMDIRGGTVVSGSFQAYDQSYLMNALQTLGSNFVGVTQLPISVSDSQLLALHEAGIRGVRFNFVRGNWEQRCYLTDFAKRIYDLLGWHVELYLEAKYLADFQKILVALPKVSIDHLGLSSAGFSDLLKLVEKGVSIKASGFSRVDFDVAKALRSIFAVNPDSLMFGTDLPCTRAPKPFDADDISLVVDAVGESAAQAIFYQNAAKFYGI